MALVKKVPEYKTAGDAKTPIVGYKFDLDNLAEAEKQALDRAGISATLRQMQAQVQLLKSPEKYAEERVAFASELTKNLVDQYENDVKAFYAATGDAEASKAAAETKLRSSTSFLTGLVESAYPGIDDAAKMLSTHLVARKTGIANNP